MAVQIPFRVWNSDATRNITISSSCGLDSAICSTKAVRDFDHIPWRWGLRDVTLPIGQGELDPAPPVTPNPHLQTSRMMFISDHDPTHRELSIFEWATIQFTSHCSTSTLPLVASTLLPTTLSSLSAAPLPLRSSSSQLDIVPMWSLRHTMRCDGQGRSRCRVQTSSSGAVSIIFRHHSSAIDVDWNQNVSHST